MTYSITINADKAQTLFLALIKENIEFTIKAETLFIFKREEDYKRATQIAIKI